MTKLKVYYAHSVALYNTAQEKRDVRMLERLGWDVMNPNHPNHAEYYRARGMDYFRGVIETCDLLAFRANVDGSINAGVGQEIEWARELDMVVLELPCSVQRRTLSLAATCELLSESGAR